MEDFNINYYAHHTRFIYCLFQNYSNMNNLGNCQEAFEKVSEESLLRDFMSRAYYTVFLKARNEMFLSDSVSHSDVLNQLDPKYKNMFRDLKTFRVDADYKTDYPITYPLKNDKVKGQYYLERLISIMDKFLSATGEQLAYSHVTLRENKKRKFLIGEI